MLDFYANPRPAEAILSRTVRVTLADTTYELPVLRIAGNRRWKAKLDAYTIALVDQLDQGGDDLPALLAALGAQTDTLMDLLVSYDESGVLPDRGVLEETVYEDELLRAVQEVWRAANPLVVTTLATMEASLRNSDSSTPTSTSPPPTAGRRKRSNGH
jgi:hypothetical protein